MLAVNKQGEVFVISFVGKSVKTLTKSKLHKPRKGWPNEILWTEDDSTADYVVCNDKLDELICLIKNNVLLPAKYSQREYCAIEAS
jgi:hypothetical protein